MHHQFFKIMVEEDFMKRLRIPDDFLKHLPKQLYEMATIKDASGCCWDVKIGMSINGIYFDDGWEKFASEHRLNFGDFLLFSHRGRMSFEVQIFDDSACERDDNNKVTVEGKRKVGRPPKRITKKRSFFKPMMQDFHEKLRIPNAFVKHLPEGSPETAIIEGPSGSCWHVKVNRSKNGLYLEDGLDKVSRDLSLAIGEFAIFYYDGNWKFNAKFFGRNACEREDCYSIRCSEEAATDQVKKTPHGRLPKGETIKGSKHELPGDSKQPGSPQVQGVSSNESNKAVNNDGENAKEAESFSSPFPHFVTEIRRYNLNGRCGLYIPSDFAKDHIPHSAKKITLRNTEGSLWTLEFCMNNRVLSSGWQAFVLENNLKVGDKCVLELVKKLQMQVHIFPQVHNLAK